MKSNLVMAALVVLWSLAACVSGPRKVLLPDPDSVKSGELLEAASAVCRREYENRLGKMKDCFTHLTGEKLIMRLRTVEPDGTLRGFAALEKVIECRPAKSPGPLELETLHAVKGKFVQYAGGTRERFIIENCEITPFASKAVYEDEK